MRNKKAPGGRGQETREIEVDAAKYAAFPDRGQGGLDACRRFRHAGGPKTTRGVASAFPASQEPEQVLPHHLHFLAVQASAAYLCGGLFAHIGGVATSSIREDWRLRLSRGALQPRLLFFSQIKRGVPWLI